MVDKKLTRIDVFKIDIEGTEPLMLRGTIEKLQPDIMGEFKHCWAEHHGVSIRTDCFVPLWDLDAEHFDSIRSVERGNKCPVVRIAVRTWEADCGFLRNAVSTVVSEPKEM
jgi:hypothetical protein